MSRVHNDDEERTRVPIVFINVLNVNASIIVDPTNPLHHVVEFNFVDRLRSLKKHPIQVCMAFDLYVLLNMIHAM